LIRKAFKVIITLVFPIAAIILSIIAISLDHIHFKESIALSEYAIEVERQHYEELTKPHTQHEEIYDKLSRLDKKIETYRTLISPPAYPNEEIDNLLHILNDAERLRDDADDAWRYKDYDKAEKLINDAYDSLAKIPTPLKQIEVWVILVAMVLASLYGAGLMFFMRDKSRKDKKTINVS